MDAFEIGWRARPSDKLLLELSLYHYDTKNAVFSGPPVYSTSNVETTGGEFTFDYRATHSWHLQEDILIQRERKMELSKMISQNQWQMSLRI